MTTSTMTTSTMSASSILKTVAGPLRPRPQDYKFDLAAALDSVVKVTASVPRDAVTADIFGTTRVGSGTCVIEPGLVVTAAHLVADASTVVLQTASGRGLSATVVGCDYVSGLALVRATRSDALRPLPIGDPSRLAVAAHVIVAACGGVEQALAARVANKQPFAGHWEYALDMAILTTPAHPHCIGAAMLGIGGELLGVTSIEILRARPYGPKEQLDLAIPIDLLTPVFDDLVKVGRSLAAPRPWLGLYAIEVEGQTIVADVAARGPADAAGIEKGDAVVAVAGIALVGTTGHRTEEFFRRVWAVGTAGAKIVLTLERDGERMNVEIESRDRNAPLRPLRMH